jgi:hypothetical protein
MWIAGGSKHTELCARAHTKFVHIGFTKKDGVAFPEPRHGRGVVRRSKVHKQFRAGCGGHVTRAECIFNGNGNACQRAKGFTPRAFGVNCVGLRKDQRRFYM